jgi:hypothetical protein
MLHICASYDYNLKSTLVNETPLQICRKPGKLVFKNKETEVVIGSEPCNERKELKN